MDGPDARYDAILLAGGAACRLGGVPKPQLAVGGRTLIGRVLEAVRGADVVAIAGPEQPVPAAAARCVRWCREEPAGGGPVAAIAAALPHTRATVVVVLAVDQPWIGPAVPRLLAAVPPDGVARLVDPDGRVNHLAAAWRRAALADSLGRLDHPAGAAARALASGVPSVDVDDPDGWGRDCDTWDDVAHARARAAHR